MIKIYSNEVKTALHAFTTHVNNPNKVLLWAKPGVQVGLTNTALKLATCMFSEHEDIGFVYLTGLTENTPFLGTQLKIDEFASIHNQTDFDTDRVILIRPEPKEMDFYKNHNLMTPLDKPDRRYTALAKHCKMLLIFLDEVHRGNGKNSQINQFLSHLIDSYGKKNVIIVAGSATPHTLLSGVSEDYIFHDSDVEILEFFVGEELFEAQECSESKRLVDVSTLEDNLKPCMEFFNSEEFKQQSLNTKNMIPELFIRCNTSITNQGKQKEEISKILTSKYGFCVNDIFFEIYNNKTKMKMAESRPASPHRKQLHIHLSIKAFSVSETISYERLQSFVGWIETKYTEQNEQNDRPMIFHMQCMRPFGYNKGRLKFPIVCSKFAIECMAKYWNADNLAKMRQKDWSNVYIPPGTYSNGSNSNKQISKTFFKRKIKNVECFKTEQEARVCHSNLSKTVISKNKSKDKKQLLSDFLSGSSRGCEDRIIYVDGPQVSDKEGWMNFQKQYPECSSSPYIVIHWEKEAIIQQASKIKPDCIMRSLNDKIN